MFMIAVYILAALAAAQLAVAALIWGINIFFSHHFDKYGWPKIPV